MAQVIELLPVLVWLLTAIGASLVGVIAWLGARVWGQLDGIAKLLREIEKDLRGDLSDLDRRVAHLEGQFDRSMKP